MKQYSKGTPLDKFNYLLGGDLSGIQEFIFNVQSEGAAKTLKGRSFFVQALADIALGIIENTLGADNCLLLFNGGGNFQLLCKTDDKNKLDDIKSVIETALKHDSLYLAIAYVGFVPQKHVQTFNEVRGKLMERLEEIKNLAFSTDYGAFLPFKPNNEDDWKGLTEGLVNSSGAPTFSKSASLARKIGRDGVNIANATLRFNPGRPSQDLTTLLPRRDEDKERQYKEALEKLRELGDPDVDKGKHKGITPFNYLAKYAWQRTKTDRLGILKMDGDNFGARFRELKDLDQVFELSQKLNDFFSKKILELLLSEWSISDGRKNRFADHIYPIFVGGDDCLLLGGWDAIMDFAPKVQKAFQEKFQSESLSLSAGIVLVQGKFPVVRFADLADTELDNAKYGGQGQKNQISIFGEALSWDEYRKAAEWAKELRHFVQNHKQPKTILRRIQRAKIGFDRLSHHAREGNISARKVWRLGWFLRSSVKNNDQVAKEFVNKLVQECTAAILSNFLGAKTPISPGVFTVAGRWAELSTRDKEQ